MKKSLLTVSLFVLLGSTFCMYGQKNKKKSSNNQNNIELKSSTDSLSYAYGVGSAQQGLTVYLAQLGVLADTATIAADYRQKINIAANQVEKETLEQKLQIALDSANNANNKNIDEFLQGVYARINDTTHSNAYSTGLDLGSQIKKIAENFSTQTLGNTEQIDLQIMVQGLANVLQNKPLLVSNSTELVEAKVKQGQSREAAKKEEENARVIAAGKAFMEENAKRPGVVSLPSGLQYTIDREGTGAIPQINDKVKVHYTGRLINGTVFDSSVDRGEPITFGLQQVIPGWTEILQLMPVGSKWTVYIPYDLAYGDRETGSIKPYSNLIFDIELLDIEK